jgi:hypothetical protein
MSSLGQRVQPATMIGYKQIEYFDHTVYEAMHAIRKGQVRWVAKGDPVGQRQFIHTIFGVAA